MATPSSCYRNSRLLTRIFVQRMRSTLSGILSSLVAVLVLAVTTLPALAVDAVRAPAQTTLTRGQLQRITISGTMETAGQGNVTLTYPANIMRIVGAEGGSGFLFDCTNLRIVSNDITGSTGTLVLNCWAIRTGTDEPLFDLVVEGLFNPTATGLLRPIELSINGSASQDAEFVTGSVTLDGESGIRPTTAEGWTGNYPNPFATESDFVFTMTSAGPARLSVRNLRGQIVKEIGTIEARAGENTYRFVPEQNELSQGAYIMQLVTDRGVYLHSFMVLK